MNDNTTPNADVARKRALLDAIRTGDPVIVTPSGEVETKNDADMQGMSGITVPDGKLA